MPYKFDTSTIRNDKGFCYIIEFSNGVIKPGKTIDLLARFNQHKAWAQKQGADALQIAFTDQHADYGKTEKLMLSSLIKNAESNKGEYLQGISFQECIRIIGDLGITTTCTQNIVKLQKARRDTSELLAITVIDLLMSKFNGNQSKLAAAVGVSQNAIWKIINKKTLNASFNVACGLADASDGELSVEYLMSMQKQSDDEQCESEREQSSPTTQPDYSIFDFMQGKPGMPCKLKSPAGIGFRVAEGLARASNGEFSSIELLRVATSEQAKRKAGA